MKYFHINNIQATTIRIVWNKQLSPVMSLMDVLLLFTPSWTEIWLLPKASIEINYGKLQSYSQKLQSIKNDINDSTKNDIINKLTLDLSQFCVYVKFSLHHQSVWILSELFNPRASFMSSYKKKRRERGMTVT